MKPIKQKAIIIDIDDTLVNESSLFTDDLPKENSRELWDKYHEARQFYNPKIYKPIQEIVDLIQGYYDSCYVKPMVFFLTSRENTCNGRILLNTYRTIRKLFRSFRQPCSFNKSYSLLMRKENDYRSSQEVKQEMLDCYIQPYYDVVLAFDDDVNNTKMFVENGVTALQVNAKGKNNGESN